MTGVVGCARRRSATGNDAAAITLARETVRKSASTTTHPQPAGALPTVTTAHVSTPTWQDHLYSCTYGYPHSSPSGSFTVSVKELSSWAETYAYFDSLAATKGKSRDLEALGQGAFQTTDGSVVVRKDWKVLLVDDTGLPAQFGVPPTSAGAVAVTVADVILGCWAGD